MGLASLLKNLIRVKLPTLHLKAAVLLSLGSMSAFKLSDVLAWLKDNPGKRPKHYNDIHDVAEAYEHRVSRMLYQCRQKADAGQLDADTDAAITEVMCQYEGLFPHIRLGPLAISFSVMRSITFCTAWLSHVIIHICRILQAWPTWRSVGPSETPQGQSSRCVVTKGGMHEGDLQGRGKGVGGEKKVGIHHIHSTSRAFMFLMGSHLSYYYLLASLHLPEGGRQEAARGDG